MNESVKLIYLALLSGKSFGLGEDVYGRIDISVAVQDKYNNTYGTIGIMDHKLFFHKGRFAEPLEMTASPIKVVHKRIKWI